VAAGLNSSFADEAAVMRRALALARGGLGHVEPNPAVGAVIVDRDLRLLGEGFHDFFGGPHAEIRALQQAGASARGGTLFVTLEPCNHHGKTPPCTQAVIAAGIRRVVIAAKDPAPHTAGSGLSTLRAAGLEVETGLCREEALQLIAPFTMLCLGQRPFVTAKWAMTLDGKIATRTGSSRWISNAEARERVHQLRGRMDAILVGIGTALADDPLLTARPAGPRLATRIVLDARARLPLNSRLLRTASEAPVMVIVSSEADPHRCEQLQTAGAEVVCCGIQNESKIDIAELLRLLGQRQLTNLLVEGGSEVLGSFWDRRLIDEVHCFIAPKLAGGKSAPTPVAGAGASDMPSESDLVQPQFEILGDNVYISGRVR
jgi:diaminohydroxyphosphoribosylaminopyrimidine deaminase/5-amino-6-(5-phosphoribosylamino)uracil reductase